MFKLQIITFFSVAVLEQQDQRKLKEENVFCL